MQTDRTNEFALIRRLQTANRTVQALLAFSLMAALNFLSANYFKRFDLTQSGAYTLAAESKAYIRQLEEPVKIIVTIPQETDQKELLLIRKDLQKLLREYEFAGKQNGQRLGRTLFCFAQRVEAVSLGVEGEQSLVVERCQFPALKLEQEGIWEGDRGRSSRCRRTLGGCPLSLHRLLHDEWVVAVRSSRKTA